MTFSLIGICPLTGQIGAAVTTSSIAVGARCAFAAAGIGAVLTQHRTDPRLGPRGLFLLGDGCDAQTTLAALVAGALDPAWRQMAVLDAAGKTAAYTGDKCKLARGEAHGPGVVAIGNILANSDVPAAMVKGFSDAPSGPLAERLVRGLEAGLAAGGEPIPVRSACLLVMEKHSFPLIDLRVDWHDLPITALRDLWERYRPVVDDYVMRATAPEHAPAL